MAEKKRNYNPKSRDNLKQFQAAGHKKRKEKITQEILEEVEIDEELLEIIIPKKDVFKTGEEPRFTAYLKAYIKEYGTKGAELTISDLDDIAQLCKNKILEDRLLKEAKGGDIGIAEVMASIDRLKKDNVKLKEQLASTRKDRVDPRAGQVMTVSDVIGEYDQERHARRTKLEDYLAEEEEVKNQCHTTVDDMIK